MRDPFASKGVAFRLASPTSGGALSGGFLRPLAGGKQDHAVAASVFGHVKGVVGDADKILDLPGNARTPACASETGGAQVADFVDEHGLVGQSSAHALGLAGGAEVVASGQDHEELFSSIAPDGVVGAHAVEHAAGELAQNCVAGEVAVRIVDRLEGV